MKKSTQVVEVVSEYGNILYYIKNNGHKMTPEEFRHNSIIKGINYDIKYIKFEGEE